MAQAKPVVSRDLERDIGAAKVLKAHLVDMLGNDAADALTLRDAIEGETDLFETINAAIAQIAEDEAAATALKLYSSRIDARKSRLEKRAEMLRTTLMNALDTTGDDSLKVNVQDIAASITARALLQLSAGKLDATFATVTAKLVPPKLQVVDEALIPSNYFKTPDPVLDNRGLTDALKARRDALKDIEGKPDAEALRAALPPIPGAELSNGGMTVQIRLS